MPHFAIVINGVVTRVERIEAGEMLDAEGNESEILGQGFLHNLYPDISAESFILTHYPVNQPEPYPRAKYACVGDIWDGTEFMAPTASLEEVTS